MEVFQLQGCCKCRVQVKIDCHILNATAKRIHKSVKVLYRVLSAVASCG